MWCYSGVAALVLGLSLPACAPRDDPVLAAQHAALEAIVDAPGVEDKQKKEPQKEQPKIPLPTPPPEVHKRAPGVPYVYPERRFVVFIPYLEKEENVSVQPLDAGTRCRISYANVVLTYNFLDASFTYDEHFGGAASNHVDGLWSYLADTYTPKNAVVRVTDTAAVTCKINADGTLGQYTLPKILALDAHRLLNRRSSEEQEEVPAMTREHVAAGWNNLSVTCREALNFADFHAQDERRMMPERVQAEQAYQITQYDGQTRRR